MPFDNRIHKALQPLISELARPERLARNPSCVAFQFHFDLTAYDPRHPSAPSNRAAITINYRFEEDPEQGQA